jgi:maltooligosyltrehalose trehalohydrolase
LRRDTAALQHPDHARHLVTHHEQPPVIVSHRWFGDAHALIVLHFGPASATARPAPPAGTWRRRLDTADTRWAGPGGAAPESLTATHDGSEAELTLAPWSAALYLRSQPR